MGDSTFTYNKIAGSIKLLSDKVDKISRIVLAKTSTSSGTIISGDSQTNFTLRDVKILPNKVGEPAKCDITGGYLAHFGIAAGSVPVWTLVSNSYDSLVDGNSYYIYAYVSRTNYTYAGNKIVLTTTAYQWDEVTDYYYFLIGTLSAVEDGIRAIAFSYGQTYIDCGFITTGKLSSADGNTYFDLNNNELVIGSGAGSIDWDDITGAAKPEDNATVGATWGTDITSIPQRFSETIPPTGSGIQITDTYMGYYSSNAWKTYIDSSGNMLLGNYAGGSAGLSWNQGASTLSIRGVITITSSSSGYANFSDKPTSLSGINATEGSKLSGIESGATAGATWGSNIASIPTQLAGTVSTTGVYITSNYIGFYDSADGGSWPISIYNDSGTGKFYAGNNSDKYISWDGSALTVQGKLQTAASGKRIVIDNASNTLSFYKTGVTPAMLTIDDDGTYGPSIYIRNDTSAGYCYLTGGHIKVYSNTTVSNGLLYLYDDDDTASHHLTNTVIS